MNSKIKFGKLISSDTDNFVQYCKYDGKLAVIKGLFAGHDDSFDLYHQEMKYQYMLSEMGYAPEILEMNIKGSRNGRKFVLWISEDGGLPIEEDDVELANQLLDELYEKGIILHWHISKELFVKGFDGKLRVTDFKQTEFYEESIGKHNRKYIKWTVS
jgi:hypothetical protein